MMQRCSVPRPLSRFSRLPEPQYRAPSCCRRGIAGDRAVNNHDVNDLQNAGPQVEATEINKRRNQA
jgi:hypothetical protein